MNDLDFLQAVRALVADPETHSRHSYFRDARGAPVWAEAEYPNAAQWSIGGAAQKVLGYTSGATYRLAKLLGFDGPYPINAMNDWQDSRRSHADILRRIDAAIMLVKSRQDSASATITQAPTPPDTSLPWLLSVRDRVDEPAPPPPFEGKGGTFAGAGASGSWDESPAPTPAPVHYDPPAPSPSYDPPSSSGGYDSGGGSGGGGGSD